LCDLDQAKSCTWVTTNLTCNFPNHSQKFGQFDRLNFTERCEKAFDRTFSYERELTKTFQYRKVMATGSALERADMIVAKRSQQIKQAREHA